MKDQDYEVTLREIARSKFKCYAENGDCFLDMVEVLELAIKADNILKKYGVYIDEPKNQG